MGELKMAKVDWKNSSKSGNRFCLEGRTSIRYNGQYFRFYIDPTRHIDGSEAWELVTRCGVSGLIASGFNKKDLKEIANDIENGETELAFIK